MAKTNKVVDMNMNAEYPTFDATRATDQFRDFAEKGMEQSKELYAKVKAGAEEAQKALESTMETAKTAGTEFSMKTISALRSNTEAGFAQAEALFGAKSLSEVIELQTSFLRKSFETTVEQMKDLQTLTSKAAEDVSKPIKTIFEKGVRDLKVA